MTWGTLLCGTRPLSVAIYLFHQSKHMRPPPMATWNQPVMRLLGPLRLTVVEARNLALPALQRRQHTHHPSRANANRAQRKRHQSKILGWKLIATQRKDRPSGRRSSRMCSHRNVQVRLHRCQHQVLYEKGTVSRLLPALMAAGQASRGSPQMPKSQVLVLALQRVLLQQGR